MYICVYVCALCVCACMHTCARAANLLSVLLILSNNVPMLSFDLTLIVHTLSGDSNSILYTCVNTHIANYTINTNMNLSMNPYMHIRSYLSS